MNEQKNGFSAQALHSVAQVNELLGRLFKVAEPGAAFAEPVVAGERSVILASELVVSMGAGFGIGGSSGESADAEADKVDSGGGGGGGGYAGARPVAVVVIERNGVHVEPIVDSTKLWLALFTTLGAMFLAWSRMRQVADQQFRSRNSV